MTVTAAYKHSHFYNGSNVIRPEADILQQHFHRCFLIRLNFARVNTAISKSPRTETLQQEKANVSSLFLVCCIYIAVPDTLPPSVREIIGRVCSLKTNLPASCHICINEKRAVLSSFSM